MKEETILRNLQEILGKTTYISLCDNLYKNERKEKGMVNKLKVTYPNAYESLLEDINSHIQKKRIESRASNKKQL